MINTCPFVCERNAYLNITHTEILVIGHFPPTKNYIHILLGKYTIFYL